MSVTFWGECPDSPTGSFSTTKDDTKTTFERKFYVLADDYDIGPMEVIACMGIPFTYQLYVFGGESHLLSRVVDRSAERKEPNSLLWVVTVKYESAEAEEDENENPLLELPKISFTFEQLQEPTEYEVDDDDVPTFQIVNSAGELYNPAVVRDVAQPVLTIQRNEPLSTPIGQIAVEYINAMNTGEFWGLPAHTWRVTAIDVSREEKEVGDDGAKVIYLSVTYKFSGRFKLWDKVLLDFGTYYKDSSDRKYKFKTEDGHPIPKGGMLDGGGHASGALFYLPAKQIYPARDYDSLNLPEAMV